MAPWGRVDRASPRQWLISRLAGRSTVVLNAHFGVRPVDDGIVASLENAEVGDTYVENTTGLGIPGRGRLRDK